MISGIRWLGAVVDVQRYRVAWAWVDVCDRARSGMYFATTVMTDKSLVSTTVSSFSCWRLGRHVQYDHSLHRAAPLPAGTPLKVNILRSGLP